MPNPIFPKNQNQPMEGNQHMAENQPMVNPPQSEKLIHKEDCCKEGGCDACLKGGMPMKKEWLSFITLLMIGIATVLGVLLINEKRAKLSDPLAESGSQSTATAVQKYEMPALKSVKDVVELPAPKLNSSTSVEEAIQSRRSKRFYSDTPVTKEELAQILWAAQGVTDDAGHRAAPSARSAYPYSLYVVVRNVQGVPEGLYLYNPADHNLGSLGLANAGDKLIEAGVQDNSQKSPVVIALTATPAIMQAKAPDSDPLPNIYLEGGHIGQNIYLETESLKMATVVTGGFNKLAVAEALGLDSANETVVYLIPFGHIGEAPVEETAK